MSQPLIRRRRRTVTRVALLSAAAAFLLITAGAATANESADLIVEPGSAEIGDTITVMGKTPCGAGAAEASVNVYWDGGDVWTTPNADGNWSHSFDTSGVDAGTYYMNAACLVDGSHAGNYANVAFTLTAPVGSTTTTTTDGESSTTTTTTEGESSTTTEGESSTTTEGESSTTTEAPAGAQQPGAAAPAVAVTRAPNYTG